MSDAANYLGASNIWNHGANTGASTGTTITAPGSLNTKGAWTQIVASTTYPAAGIMLQINSEPGSGDCFWLADVGIGGAGSEVVIVPNIIGGRLASTLGDSSHCYVPVQIPAGSRVAMRYQVAVTAATPLTAQIIGFGDSGKFYPPPMALTDYGTVTASSKGTQVDPGGTANTKGAYAQLVASTTQTIRGLIVQILPDASYAAAPAHSLVDIAIGGAGSEQVVIPNIMHNPTETSGSVIQANNAPFYYPASIPSGSRIAARSQCDTNTAANRKLTVSVIGCA